MCKLFHFFFFFGERDLFLCFATKEVNRKLVIGIDMELSKFTPQKQKLLEKKWIMQVSHIQKRVIFERLRANISNDTRERRQMRFK